MPEEPRSLERRLWAGILAVAGAAAGFAALVYLIGATTLWLALRNRGYSPDVAIEHQSKAQLVGVGLRGIVAVGGLTLVLVLFLVVGAALNLLPKVESVAKKVRFRYQVVVALALVVAASFASWRWLALAIPVAALVVVIAAQSRISAYRRRWSWAPLLIAAVLAALAWQYGGPVLITAADVEPDISAPIVNVRYSERPCARDGKAMKSFYTILGGKQVWIAKFDPCGYGRGRTRSVDDVLADLRSCDVPYFGQSRGFVYLGAIRNVWRDRFGRCRWAAGPIVERRRDRIQLRYLGGKIFLNQAEDRTKPYEAAWKAGRSFWRKLHSPA